MSNKTDYTQVDTIDSLREKHSLRNLHAFDSELVKKSETEKAC